MGAFQNISNSINNNFETLVAVPRNIDVQYDNDPTPPTTGLWVRLTILNGIGLQGSLGGTNATVLYRNPGVMVAQIFQTALNMTDNSNFLADFIDVAFRSKTLGGVLFRKASIANIGRVGDEYQINVSIPFQYDDIT